jgi:hypothetical protein
MMSSFGGLFYCGAAGIKLKTGAVARAGLHSL